MTREERNTKLKHFITCLKCEVSGKECDDNCPVQYKAGNMGEIIENLEAISKALEQEPCEDELDFVQEHKKISCNLIVEPCEDCISRQAVLEAIDIKAWEFCNYLISKNRNDEQKPVSHFANNLRECVREELPSVNPQYTENEIQKIQDLEQAEIEKAYELGKAEGQESDDAISRQVVLDVLRTMYDTHIVETEGGDEYIDYNDTVYEIKDLPPVNPQPKTGHWIFDEILDKHYYCSECKSMGVDYWDFCPNCGAKMVEPQESEVQDADRN